MNKLKLNNRVFIIILSGFILITSSACSNGKNEASNYKNQPGVYETKSDNYDISLEKEINTSVESTNNIQSEINNVKEETKIPIAEIQEENILTEDDNQIINYFKQLEQSVDEVVESEIIETTKDKLKGTFITIVDFIFYEGEIKGIKFDDLTEGAKQNILETATSIDNKIMTKFPNYKEEISSKVSSAYNKASELMKKGANNIKDFSKDKLGEEYYNAIIDSKDELVYYTKNAFSILGDITSTIWEKSKEKVKNWYESFQNN